MAKNLTSCFSLKYKESYYYFRFAVSHVVSRIDAPCFHCRSISICVGDPQKHYVTIRNCVSIHVSSKVITTSGLRSTMLYLIWTLLVFDVDICLLAVVIAFYIIDP